MNLLLRGVRCYGVRPFFALLSCRTCYAKYALFIRKSKARVAIKAEHVEVVVVRGVE